MRASGRGPQRGASTGCPPAAVARSVAHSWATLRSCLTWSCRWALQAQDGAGLAGAQREAELAAAFASVATLHLHALHVEKCHGCHLLAVMGSFSEPWT